MRYLNRYPVLFLILVLLIPSVPASTQITGKNLLAESTGNVAGEDGRDQTGNQALVSQQYLEKAIDPDEYVLGPNDMIIINLVGPDQRFFRLSVLPEGYVFIPGIGALGADGLTLTDFRKKLEAEADRYFHNISVFCYLLVPRRFRVFVTGEVGKPGAVEISAVERVSDAVEKAGSILTDGSNREVILEREGRKIKVDVLRFLMMGEFKSNPFLSNGDRIHVPVAKSHVVIRGSVKKPGVYELVTGETVDDMIALAGGLSGEAVSDTILLSRVMEDGTVSTFAIPESEFDDALLRDRDEINVMDGMIGTSRVYVFGATTKTGHYFITEGERLAELVGRIGRFDADADLGAASIERSDGEIIRLDLKEYIPPSSKTGISLRDGDMLHIPKISMMVAVGGEVQLPGRFPYEGDWTVAQYVGLAGGPTGNGSIDRVVIYSPDGRSRAGDRNTRPNRGDIIIVKRSKSSIFGGFFDMFVRVGTVVVTMIVLTR
ncbi:MAG: SLBB domain-containing protein [Candidatus Krumholzibacteriota bacterium]|nr:SLBB domain-containing protein [Candidatus Krumholzibacteriota bacterium]